MSYDDYETSQEAGQPIELYEFYLGSTYYRYTSNMADVTIAGATYEAIPISRGNVVAARDDSSRDRIEITMPASALFAQQFIGAVPSRRATVALRRFHRNDPALETIVVFLGTIATARFVDEGATAKMTAIPITTAQSRPIPRQTYQGLCNHMLYDARCQINEASATWRKTLTVTVVTGNVLTIPGADAWGADFFVGGIIFFDDDYRLVTAQSGADLQIFTPFRTSPLGRTVRLNAGCKHRITDCRDKFSNIENFGGFPFVPLKNPFETGI